MFNVADIEKAAEQIIKNVQEHEGSLNFIAGLAGILPEVQLAEKALPLLVQGLHLIEQETGKSPLDAFKDLVDHLTPSAPNSVVLSPDPSEAQQASTT